MKNLKILAILFLSVTIFSCSKDDDSSPTPSEESLVGIWNLTDVKQNGETTTVAFGKTTTSTFNATGKDYDAQVELKQNPNEFVSTGGYTSVVTTTIEGQTSTENVAAYLDDQLNQGSWSVKGNEFITKRDNGDEQRAKILVANDSTLKLEMNVEQEIDAGIYSVSTKMTVTMTLTRK